MLIFPLHFIIRLFVTLYYPVICYCTMVFFRYIFIICWFFLLHMFPITCLWWFIFFCDSLWYNVFSHYMFEVGFLFVESLWYNTFFITCLWWFFTFRWFVIIQCFCITCLWWFFVPRIWWFVALQCFFSITVTYVVVISHYLVLATYNIVIWLWFMIIYVVALSRKLHIRFSFSTLTISS